MSTQMIKKLRNQLQRARATIIRIPQRTRTFLKLAIDLIKETRIFWLLFAVSCIMLVYQIPEYIKGVTPRYSFFIFNPEKMMTSRNALWHLGNKISWCIYIYCIYYLVPKDHKPYMKLFLIMQVSLLVEFCLFYNAAWFMMMDSKVGFSQFFIIFNALILIHVTCQNKPLKP
jgi:hypothetical protein